MTTINKSKVTIINWGLTTIFIVICFLLSLIQSQEAYADMKKVSVTSKLVTELTEYVTYFDQTKVRFRNNLHICNSADPDWDKAKIFFVTYYINPTDQGDDYRGFTAITHPNGDQTFFQYDGSWKWVLPRDGNKWTSENSGLFTGGTGKFEGIIGRFTFKGKGDGFKFITGEWEVEYEVK